MNSTQALASAFVSKPELIPISENERRILHLVRRSRSTTRAELSRQTHLAAQSVSRLVDGLIGKKLLTAGARIQSGRRGQPSIEISLDPAAAYSVGLSVATDFVAVSLVDFAGAAVHETQMTPGSVDRRTVVNLLREEIDNACRQHAIPPERIFGLGVAIAGFFAGDGKSVNPSSELDDWALVDIPEYLNTELGLPVWLENDGTAAAIGESLVGIGQWASTFAYLYFARGFGGGMVVDGKPLRGAHGNAGEFGGMLDPDSQDYPNLEGLRQLLGEDGHDFASIHEMVAGLDCGWPAVRTWIERASKPISGVVTAIATCMDPQAIVFGGEMPRELALELIASVKIRNTDRRNRPRPNPRLVASEKPGSAAPFGAATIPLKSHFFV